MRKARDKVSNVVSRRETASSCFFFLTYSFRLPNSSQPPQTTPRPGSRHPPVLRHFLLPPSAPLHSRASQNRHTECATASRIPLRTLWRLLRESKHAHP